MYSGEIIKQFQADAAAKASKSHKVPYVIWPDDVGNLETLRRIPNLGDFVPDGWTEVERHFVDSSGFGEEGEAAMTPEEFADKLKVGTGYALVSEGQFQVYVGEFKRTG